MNTRLSLLVLLLIASATHTASVKMGHTKRSTQRTMRRRNGLGRAEKVAWRFENESYCCHSTCLCSSTLSLLLTVARCPINRPFHNRLCKPWTECTDNQFEALAPTAFQDRVCSTKTTCDVSAGQTLDRPVEPHCSSLIAHLQRCIQG